MTRIMGKKRDKLGLVRFHCPECDHRWEGEPGRVVDVPDKSHHPWDYFAECPACGEEAHQDRREQSWLKAWANATGPRTQEGLERTAKNLDGHPTPEEARRTRFNAMKHGAFANTAHYFPAKPGRYPECDGCPYFHSCGIGGNFACQRKTELFLQHDIAFDAQDPSLLQGLRARMHATVTAILDMIMQDIIARGVMLETPAWYYDKDGGFHLAEFEVDHNGNRIIAGDRDPEDWGHGERQLIMEVKEHPLLKRMSEIIKSTGMTLADSGMTMAAQQDRDDIAGHLEGEKGDRQTLLEYQKQQADALSGMQALLDRAAKREAEDPIALEHKQNAD